MAAKGSIVVGKVGPTGRYVFCPYSNTTHGLFAKQVTRSKNGNLWFRCVCGLRGYAPSGAPVPKMTRDAALKAGALIPDEMI
jgi:hypothetical protein